MLTRLPGQVHAMPFDIGSNVVNSLSRRVSQLQCVGLAGVLWQGIGVTVQVAGSSGVPVSRAVIHLGDDMDCSDDAGHDDTLPSVQPGSAGLRLEAPRPCP